jgi:formate/nitrite transporter
MNDVSPPQAITLDPILPAAMATRAEENGVRRVATDPLTVLALSVLAGAFIAFGAIFATTVSAGSAELPYGVGRLLTGLVFTVGLIMVIVGGAELFTGNNMIVMAWASGKVSTAGVLTNWGLAFAGNFAGAFLTACLMFLTTQYTFGNGAVGLSALSIAHAKAALAPMPAFMLGIFCNALVCLTVWMCFAARTTIDRVATAMLPIAAFVAAGFEHCIANIYFIPIALFIKAGAPASFWTAIGKAPADYPALTWENFLLANLLPVTLGNMIGGSVMVAAVYWFIYLRKRAA